MLFDDSVSQTFNWLSGDHANQVAAICKKHGAKVQRLAQSRGVLGYCKIVAKWSLHSWYASSQAYGAAKAELKAAGLIRSITIDGEYASPEYANGKNP